MNAGRPSRNRAHMGPSLFKVEGVDVEVEIRPNPRARRFILRVDPRTRRAVVTIPAFTSEAEALSFACSKRVWILSRLAEAPPPRPFVNGCIFPLEGSEATVLQVEAGRGARFDQRSRTLSIASAPEHVNRRAIDWLKRRARERLIGKCDEYAAALGQRRGPVRVRDQRTRWGSCSSDRVLSFSWRLILAPPPVLDYVAAHECAHLRHMNHSAAFWRLLESTGVDREYAESWLKDRGQALFQWGAEA